MHHVATASSRRNSEDRVLVIERRGSLVVVLADGAGGMRGGAAASDAFVHAVRKAAEDDAFDVDGAAAWGELFARVDHELACAFTGETTAIVITLAPHGITGTSVGDSEAWLVGVATIDDLTAGQDRHRLGSGRAIPVAFARPPLTSTLLAATDGLFKHAAPHAIAEAARSGSVDAVVALARLPSRRYADDLALALVTIA